MSLTTSTSINEPKASVCSRCGHAGGLLVRGFSDHTLSHDPFIGCPEGEPESPGGLDVAYDALGEDGASLDALEHLAAKGVVITREKSVAPAVAEVHEAIIGRPGWTVDEEGRAYADVREFNLAKARKAQEASGFKPSFPGESAEEDAYLKGAAVPLGSGRRNSRRPDPDPDEVPEVLRRKARGPHSRA